MMLSSDTADLPEETGSGLDSLRLMLRAAREAPMLSRRRQTELLARARTGDQPSQAALVESYLRLVVSIGRRYEGKGLPLPDLLQEGAIALTKCVENPRVQAPQFASYATLAITGQMHRALESQSRIVRVPRQALEEISRVKRLESELWMQLRRIPTTLEIVEAMAEPALGENAVARARTYADAHLAEANTLFDALSDENFDSQSTLVPSVAVLNEERRELALALATLSARERDVVIKRFSLDGRGERTLQEIAIQLEISRERVHQLEKTALWKLRGQMAGLIPL